MPVLKPANPLVGTRHISGIRLFSRPLGGRLLSAVLDRLTRRRGFLLIREGVMTTLPSTLGFSAGLGNVLASRFASATLGRADSRSLDKLPEKVARGSLWMGGLTGLDWVQSFRQAAIRQSPRGDKWVPAHPSDASVTGTPDQVQRRIGGFPFQGSAFKSDLDRA